MIIANEDLNIFEYAFALIATLELIERLDKYEKGEITISTTD